MTIGQPSDTAPMNLEFVRKCWLAHRPQLERSPSLFAGNVIAGAQKLENPGDSPRALQLGFVLPQHPSELLIKHLRIVRLGRLVALGIGLVVPTDAGQFSWIEEDPSTFWALVHDHIAFNAPKMAHRHD